MPLLIRYCASSRLKALLRTRSASIPSGVSQKPPDAIGPLHAGSLQCNGFRRGNKGAQSRASDTTKHSNTTLASLTMRCHSKYLLSISVNIERFWSDARICLLLRFQALLCLVVFYCSPNRVPTIVQKSLILREKLGVRSHKTPHAAGYA